MEDFFMDIHSSCSQSYVTLTCGRIIPASHQSEISTFIVVVGIDPALWTEVLTKFNWKSWGIWRPQACLFNASLLWVGKSTMYSISHNWCLGGQCSIMWFDKQQLCYNILYVCWLHVQNSWSHCVVVALFPSPTWLRASGLHTFWRPWADNWTNQNMSSWLPCCVNQSLCTTHW